MKTFTSRIARVCIIAAIFTSTITGVAAADTQFITREYVGSFLSLDECITAAEDVGFAQYECQPATGADGQLIYKLYVYNTT